MTIPSIGYCTQTIAEYPRTSFYYTFTIYSITLQVVYLAEIVEAVLQNDGTLLRFTGDGLIAVYGAPLEHPTPALSAVLTGIEIQRRLETLSEKRAAVGKQALETGIGINTGEAMLGSIGSEKRQQYSAIGDIVNVAQRAEGQCIPGSIAITQETYQEVKHHVVAEPMGMRDLKGRDMPVMLYKVIASK